MTVELLMYGILCILCIFTSIVDIERIIFRTMIMISLPVYSIVIRTSGYDYDIGNYRNIMTFTDITDSLYYMKEPIYWLSSNWMHRYMGIPELWVFVIFDCISFYVIYKSSCKMKLPYYFVFAFIVFFPSHMGIQNIYRQYLAMVVILLSLSYKDESMKSVLFLIVAVLIHNVSALFIPIIILRTKIRYKTLIFYLSSIVMTILLPIAISTKSFNSSGASMGAIYLFVISAIILFYLLSTTKRNLITEDSLTLIYLLFVTSVSVIFMGSAQGERVGMISLAILLIFIIKIIDDIYEPTLLARLILTISIPVPTIAFTSSYIFLISENIQ